MANLAKDKAKARAGRASVRRRAAHGRGEEGGAVAGGHGAAEHPAWEVRAAGAVQLASMNRTRQLQLDRPDRRHVRSGAEAWSTPDRDRAARRSFAAARGAGRPPAGPSAPGVTTLGLPSNSVRDARRGSRPRSGSRRTIRPRRSRNRRRWRRSASRTGRTPPPVAVPPCPRRRAEVGAARVGPAADGGRGASAPISTSISRWTTRARSSLPRCRPRRRDPGRMQRTQPRARRSSRRRGDGHQRRRRWTRTWSSLMCLRSRRRGGRPRWSCSASRSQGIVAVLAIRSKVTRSQRGDVARVEDRRGPRRGRAPRGSASTIRPATT